MEGGMDQTQHRVGRISIGQLQTGRVDKSALGAAWGKAQRQASWVDYSNSISNGANVL